MTAEELRIQRMIKGILVRNYVDSQKLDVQVIGQSAYIEGEFKVFDYNTAKKEDNMAERDFNARRTITHVEQQIRGLGEISYLEMKLTNWSRQGTQWVASRRM